MSESVFDSCLTTLGEDVSDRELLQCVAVGVSPDESTYYARTVLLVLCAALVFFMQAGFAM